MDPKERVMSLVDRDLVTEEQARRRIARWSPDTCDTYAGEWAAALDWWQWYRGRAHTAAVRAQGPDAVPVVPVQVMPWPPDRLALYVRHLVELDRKPSTIRKALAALKGWHRLHGLPVPDGAPALAVLQDHQDTLTAAGWVPERADPVPLATLVKMLTAMDGGTARGRRDACLLALTWAGMATAPQVVGMRVHDVEPVGDGVRIRRDGAGGRWLHIAHRPIAGEYRPGLCPADCITCWHGYLLRRGAPLDSPLIRPVDARDHVAGLDPTAGAAAADGQMSRRALGPWLTGILAAAGLAVDRHAMVDVRVGGIVQRRLDGLSLDELADESGLTSWATLPSYAAIAERWAADPERLPR